METLETYENKKILLGDDGLPKYILDPFPFSEDEIKILNNHEKLFTQMELEAVRKEPDIVLRKRVLDEYLESKIPDSKNKNVLVEEIISRVMGYGKLSQLIIDDNLEEIMVNGIGIPVFVFHKKYGMCSTNILFESREEIFKIINKLCWIHNKEIDPIIDMSAIDGSRINMTIEPLAIHGPSMTIRKQKTHFLTITELINNKTIDLDVAALLWLAVDGMRISPANVMIAGMIGSGKTTLLNAMTMLSPPEERIVSIEETPELQLSGKKNWVPLISDKEHDMEALVRNTLRMRPNKIVIGEIRGSEAMGLFNAMNVGHKGMGTMHANSSREVIFRLESSPMNVPMRIISNLDLIVIMNIFNYAGKPIRRVTEIAEVGGHEGNTILLGEIYQWDPKEDRAVKSDELTPSAFLDKLASKIKVKKRDIVAELKQRENFLASMINEQIFEYNEVLLGIKEFYKEESTLVGSVAKDTKKK